MGFWNWLGDRLVGKPSGEVIDRQIHQFQNQIDIQQKLINGIVASNSALKLLKNVPSARIDAWAKAYKSKSPTDKKTYQLAIDVLGHRIKIEGFLRDIEELGSQKSPDTSMQLERA